MLKKRENTPFSLLFCHLLGAAAILTKRKISAKSENDFAENAYLIIG